MKPSHILATPENANGPLTWISGVVAVLQQFQEQSREFLFMKTGASTGYLPQSPWGIFLTTSTLSPKRIPKLVSFE
jgi:hypothetical protein